MADLHDIARAMVALPGWRWLGGARAIRESDGVRFRVVLAGDAYEDTDGTAEWANVYAGGFLPDLTDPATLGAIEHGLLAPAGVWIWRSSTVLVGGKLAVMACAGSYPTGRALGAAHGSLPAALLDGLRSIQG